MQFGRLKFGTVISIDDPGRKKKRDNYHHMVYVGFDKDKNCLLIESWTTMEHFALVTPMRQKLLRLRVLSRLSKEQMLTHNNRLIRLAGRAGQAVEPKDRKPDDIISFYI